MPRCERADAVDRRSRRRRRSGACRSPTRTSCARAGVRTTFGSRAFADHVPDGRDELARRARRRRSRQPRQDQRLPSSGCRATPNRSSDAPRGIPTTSPSARADRSGGAAVAVVGGAAAGRPGLGWRRIDPHPGGRDRARRSQAVARADPGGLRVRQPRPGSSSPARSPDRSPMPRCCSTRWSPPGAPTAWATAPPGWDGGRVPERGDARRGTLPARGVDRQPLGDRLRDRARSRGARGARPRGRRARRDRPRHRGAPLPDEPRLRRRVPHDLAGAVRPRCPLDDDAARAPRAAHALARRARARARRARPRRRARLARRLRAAHHPPVRALRRRADARPRAHPAPDRLVRRRTTGSATSRSRCRTRRSRAS